MTSSVTAAVLTLLGTLAAVAAAGLALRARSGRTRPAPDAAGTVRDVVPGGFDGVTLLQLSTTFCAQCRQARTVLADFTAEHPGVRHVEIDLIERPELADRLRVRHTPTTLAVDPAGRELFRVSGIPRPQRLSDALNPQT